MPRQLDEAILDRLRYDGPATWTDLAAAVDAHPARVRRRCGVLQDEGVLRLTTGGLYTVGQSNRPETNAPSDANGTGGRTAASD
jgi:DeoR/GlpR family transcriptional regulator of sugar metabolism